MSSLCSQRDHSRKETFGRGAVKLCREWEGDAFGIFARFRRSLLAVTPHIGSFALTKTIRPATQASQCPFKSFSMSLLVLNFQPVLRG